MQAPPLATVFESAFVVNSTKPMAPHGVALAAAAAAILSQQHAARASEYMTADDALARTQQRQRAPRPANAPTAERARAAELAAELAAEQKAAAANERAIAQAAKRASAEQAKASRRDAADAKAAD
ncbi:hypothetical protein EMIHUDRAFT_260697, partial [Emiliania huxleyi CCMP1516]|uniref:Uncharacterized protein n=2 Tax=Emiliania huxleyi TaxID=2903 RepID=A0A0D3KSE5_EMIH1